MNPSNYHPTTPEEFIGQANAVAQLLQRKANTALSGGDGPVKLLLYGASGVGKTRLAEMLAKRIAPHKIFIESTNGRNVTIDVVRNWMQAAAYRPQGWTVKIVNELDTAPAAAQDLLLTYLDEMREGHAFIGTSNMQLNLLQERFQTRLQQLPVQAPDTETIVQFLRSKWKEIQADVAAQIAVGSGGNVRAALMDAQSYLDSMPA
jgi:replication-associated recombination protein RarA